MATVGTSRNSRGNPALRPGWLAIDDRTPRQLLAGTPRTAALFRYFDETNRANGHWDAFFEHEPLIHYAALAECDVANEQRVIQANLDGIGATMQPAELGDQAGAWTVIERLLFLYRRIDRAAAYFGRFSDEEEYAGMLQQAITGPLRENRRAVLQCRAWLKAHPRYPFETAGWPGAQPDAAIAVFDDAWQIIGETAGPGDLTAETFLTQLAAASRQTLATMAQLVQAAASWFADRFANPSGLQPHFALYLAFLRQFGRAQEALNRIPQRHTEYFFRDVLHLRPRGVVPDTAYVTFSPASTTWVPIPAGTLLSAGKDPNGLPISYATVTDLTVTPATVARFATVFLAEPTANGGSGFYFAPVANSADGNGAPLAAGASWATFGEEQSGRPPTQRTMADAMVGFAVSSPVLYLQSGRRTIELVIAYTRPPGTLGSVSNPQPPLPTVPGQIDYTGLAGWTEVPAVQTACALHYGLDEDGSVAPLNLTFTITLAPGDPACTNYDPKVLGPGYDPRVPALRVRYANPLTAFPAVAADVRAAFLTAPVAAAEIRVNVDGMRPDVIYGAGGTLAPDKPMPLFGAPVQPSAQLLLGSVELFRKQPLSLTVALDWVGLPTDPNGLSDYFSDYRIAFPPPPPPNAFQNDQYRVRWSAMFEGAWQRIDELGPPPAGQVDGEFLFAWTPTGTTPVTSSPVGTLATTNSWAAEPAALASWTSAPGLVGPVPAPSQATTGLLQCTLVAPDYLFGQPLYATAVSKIALQNALAIASASKPPPPPPSPSSYTLAAAYRTLTKPPAAMSIWQQIGRVFKLGAAPSATFKTAVLPAVTAAGGFSAEVKAFVLGAGKLPDETYAALIAMLTKPPAFDSPDTFAAAVATSLALDVSTAEGKAARSEIIGWMASLLYQPTPVPPPVLLPLPRPPLVPTATNLRLTYAAEAKITLGPNPPAAQPWDRLWQISPFAVTEMASGTSLLPHVATGGTLFLGIAGAQVPQVLSLLFVPEPLPITELPVTLADPAKWSMLVGDTWKPADTAIHRGTDGFLRVGIVRGDLGADVDVTHTVMPSGLVWVRAEVATPAAHLRTMQMLVNATTATWVPPAGMTTEELTAHVVQPLPAGSITGLAVPNAGIAGVVQPLPSSGGVPPETDDEFHTRVSERLRHKGRAVALRDYERILVEQFPSVFYARAVPSWTAGAPEGITVMALPTIRGTPVVSPPGFVPGDLALMSAALAGVAPLTAQVSVVNPTYDYVRLTVAVRFRGDRSPDFYTRVLGEDLAAFISPWIVQQATVVEPARSFRVSDFSTFLRSRPYVTYFGPCSVAVVPAQGGTAVVPSDIVAPSGPLSLLVAAPTQNISLA